MALWVIFAISFLFATPTSAITCDPTNIHQPICISVAVDNADLQLFTTDRDTNGVIYGNHSINISSNSVGGFNLSMSSDNDDDSTDLINFLPNDRSDRIPSITKAGPLTSKSWGYTLSNPTNNTNTTYEPIPSPSSPAKLYSQTTNGNTQQLVYYGVRLDDAELASTFSGSYTDNVIYTVTANVAAPTITAISPDNYTVGYSSSDQITITGTNLAPAYDIYIGLNNSGAKDTGEECTDIKVINDNTVTCNIPTNYDHRTADLPLRLTAQGGVATTTFTYINSICRNADDESDCQVDIDKNMIPIRYTSSTTEAKWATVTDDEVENSKGAWYDYGNKQWANAITVKKDKLSAYQNSDGSITESKEVDEADILGYYVYIPRYAYEVMRRDATDKVVQPQNFNIRFETAGDTKKNPKPCSSNQLIKTMGDMWANGTADNVESNIKAKDYRTGCGINRDYPANTLGQSSQDQSSKQNSDTTWATHPAFTWTYTKEANGFDQTTELNGFWMGKFETTGSIKAPTILPSQYHKTNELIGVYYDIAKSVATKDSNNTYGNSTATTQNSHNLSTAKSHLLKNAEWGAMAYLSTSHYGAGIKGVQINSSSDSSVDGDGETSVSLTGCGPMSNGNTETYTCQTSVNNQYNGAIGQLASSTNNTTGIYDIAGGAYENVSAGITDGSKYAANKRNVATAFRPPYVNLFVSSSDGGAFDVASAWSSGTISAYYNNDQCTWTSCGGQALHETNRLQSINNGAQAWLNNYPGIPTLLSRNSWLDRGGAYLSHGSSGIFHHGEDSGDSQGNQLTGAYGFRISILSI